MEKNRNKFSYIILVILLYLYLHNPNIPFLGPMVGLYYGCIKLMEIMLLLFILNKKITFRRYKCFFRREINIYVLAAVYALFRTFLGGNAPMMYQQIYSILDVVLMPLLIFYYAQKANALSAPRFINTLLIVSAIASCISAAAYMFPGLQELIKYCFMSPQAQESMERAYRGFGLSENLTSNYAYIQATMIIFFLYYIKRCKWFIYFIPFVLISIVFNARTGIVILALGIMIYLLTSRNFKSLFAFVIVGFLFYTSFDTILAILHVPEEARAWFGDFSDEAVNMYEGGSLEDSGTLYALFDRMFILPNNIQEWVIGRGYTLFGQFEKLGVSSDVGFINILSYGGLIYSIILYLFVYFVCKRLHRFGYNWYAMLFFVIFMIVNIKSSFLPICGELRLLFLVYAYLLYSKVYNTEAKLFTQLNL